MHDKASETEHGGPLAALAMPLATARGALWGGTLGAWRAIWMIGGVWVCELLWHIDPWAAASRYAMTFDDFWVSFAERLAVLPARAWELVVCGTY